MIANSRIVIINLNAFDVNEDTAALIGGTLLNLAARAVSWQSVIAPELRKKVTIAVDEFHTIPGADYEQVFGELSKYGANMILATQTLARLDRLTQGDRARDLRAAVFSNLDGLFAFHVSAEDAEYLAEELGGGLNKQDLLELGHYQCYARITDARTGERLPAFTVRLEPPASGNSKLIDELAGESAQRYGRNIMDVGRDLDAANERVRGPQPVTNIDSQPASVIQQAADGGGTPSAVRAPNAGRVPPGSRARGKGSKSTKSTATPIRLDFLREGEGTEHGTQL